MAITIADRSRFCSLDAVAITLGEIFGEFLRAAREIRGLTQQEMADRAKITQSMISGLESGKKKITSDNVARILEGLNMEAPLMCEIMARIGHDLEAEHQPAKGQSVRIAGGLADKRMGEKISEVLAKARRRRQSRPRPADERPAPRPGAHRHSPSPDR